VNEQPQWSDVIAILQQRFPLQLEIAILQERVNRLETVLAEDGDKP
jgi:hypothetical protein